MITIIFGKIGAGKTALLTHILNGFAFDKDRNRQMRMAIKAKNEGSERELTIPPHCVSANYECTFRKFGYRPRVNRVIDPSRLCIYDKKSGIQPHFNFPYEVIGVDEAQRWFCGKGKDYLNSWQSRWFEMHRHIHLDIYLAVQRAMLIDKNIRDLAQGIEVQTLKKYYDKYGKVIRLKWIVNVINEGDIENYLNASAADKKKYCRQEVIKANYNVFLMYNSFSLESKFYEGHEGEDLDLNYRAV